MSDKKKVLFVATVVKTHIMQFHIPYLQMFQEHGWETAVASRNDYENPQDCQIPYCDHYYPVDFERNPIKPGNIGAYRELKRIIDEGDYDIIHCHTPMGGVLARLAGRAARKRGCKMIYTAHGFHFFDGAPLPNWLMYYPVEKHLARDTDILITMNREDYQRALKKMPAKQVTYVHGVGVDTKRFATTSVAPEELRKEIGVAEDEAMILTVGELIKRKNHELVLRALAPLTDRKWKYVIVGRGVLLDHLKQVAEECGISDRVLFLGYRRDIPEMLHACDLFAFTSLQEGLPVAIMEAMAAGAPIVCTRNRGTADLIEDGVSGSFTRMEVADLTAQITRLLDQPNLRKQYARESLKRIGTFDIDVVKKEMERIYFE
ncbi:MAG: glycosyltransferase family 4 protein [Lachnospiraceae bacterium]|nr:glycosyltransferase family 4 protein [Lachnospiraceae bacterium]